MYCGVDLGSRNVKIALMDSREELKFFKFDTITFYREHGRLEDGQLAVDLSALLPPSTRPRVVVSTGYGRQTVALKGARTIPEIKAHVLGAIHFTGLSDFTLLDLGGQDSKVALVRGGRLVDFQTNDKCAASTGRYLENMAAVLNITLDELSRYYENPVDLSSTCAIFGETELIGKVVEGHPISSLAAGVNYTIFKRIRPMLQRLYSEILVFTGGVARNTALRKILARELGVQVMVPENPQYTGAVGCCVEARLRSPD
ncbi:CoA-substrate-specific enzyme activase, putative [Desulfofundulus australicus DSM 11792]|uniref:CoA-substrate-specific enzyme activase, putative n=1 Tax=Desulfofundulus australicus DSM 11792 TaxID=1121425 RepID=A0A1M4X3Q1_9FIRM|nr:acyl-CoA dehydratase activase [Desulfofundulus australicus]SHE88128.1 CoA-substrate-specific enzyme activase, putative [Desulfofundulus australicus DSM 11792]